MRRVVLAVRADGVAGLVDLAHHVGKGMRHFTDHEKCRLHALRGKRGEDLVGGRRQRSVVESEDHFLVAKRQCLRILQRADARKFAKSRDDYTTGADRIRISGAVRRARWPGAEKRTANTA